MASGLGREAGLQITDLQKRAGIVRIVLDDPLYSAIARSYLFFSMYFWAA